MSSFGYYEAIQQLLEFGIDLLSDNIRCGLLTNEYVPDQSDSFLSDVTALEPTYSGSILLTNKAIISNDTTQTAYFDADDIAWDETIHEPVRYLFIYKDSGLAATSNLICLIDLGGERNAPLFITWNNNGIFGISSSEAYFQGGEFSGADPAISDGWVYVNTGWWKQGNPNVVPLTADVFDAIAGGWTFYNNCETATTPFGFASIIGGAGLTQISQTTAMKKEGNGSIKVDFLDTSAVYGQSSTDIDKTSGVVAFWLNLDDLIISDFSQITIWVARSGVSVSNWLLAVRRNGTIFQIQASIRDDAGAVISGSWCNLHAGWNHIMLLWNRSTGAGKNDGANYLFIDGDRVDAHTGLDNDTKDWDFGWFGMVFTGATELGGAYYFDEIYQDNEGAPFTVAIKQQQAREYSLCIPHVPTAAAGIYVDLDHGSDYTEWWFEFDFDDSSIHEMAARSHGIFAAYDTGVTWEIIIYYAQDAQDTPYLSFWVKTDTGNVAENVTGIASGVGVPLGPKTYAVYWRQSSGSDDGECFLMINGEIVKHFTGLDNDAQPIDRSRYGLSYGADPATYGLEFFNTMRHAREDTVYSIKNWAAPSGYGLVNYIPPASYDGYLRRWFGNSSHYTSEATWDFNNLTMAHGDSFASVGIQDIDGSARVAIEIVPQKINDDLYLYFQYLSPGLGWGTVGSYVMPPSLTASIRFVFQRSTSGAISDGYCFVYVDDVLVAYDETIATYLIDGDTFLVSNSVIDAGTYGSYNIYDIKFNQESVFKNPLNTNYDCIIYNWNEFDEDVLAEFEESYFIILPFSSLDYSPVTILSKPDIVTPGMAEYKVILKNQEGEIVAEFDNWRSLAIARRVNTFGSCRFEIDGWDSRTSLFELDSQIEIWRRNRNVGLDWYLEWEGFHRTHNDLIQVNGKRSFVSFSVGYLHLLKRKHILWYASSDGATKSGLSGGTILSYVNENAGPAALQVSGRVIDGVFPGLVVGADAGYGNDWSGSRAWKNLFDVIIGIAEPDNLYLDITGIGQAQFEFNVYDQQRGLDRTASGIDHLTGLNPYGNVPAVFSTEFGNMELPNVAINRANEINRALALGAGVETDRSLALTQYVDRMTDSPWNAIEGTIQASNEGDDTTKLLMIAKQYVEQNLYDETFSFNVIQTKSLYYGKDYWFGDKATFRYVDLEMDKQISGVKITVSENAEGEKVSIEVEDNIRG